MYRTFLSQRLVFYVKIHCSFPFVQFPYHPLMVVPKKQAVMLKLTLSSLGHLWWLSYQSHELGLWIVTQIHIGVTGELF